MNQRYNYILLSLIGLTNGMIPMLIGSTLFIWLKESGMSLKVIGLYSLANLPFAFSFAISAFLEYCSSKKHFSYKIILLSCLSISSGLIYLLPKVINDQMLIFIVCSILSVTITIVRVILLALQKILFDEDKLLIVINVSTISFKVGLLIGGSSAIFLSQFYHWSNLYQLFSVILVIFCMIIALFPDRVFNIGNYNEIERGKLLTRIIAPFTNLFSIPQISLILLLMFFYRAPDNLITHYFDLFYLNSGLDKTSVAFGYRLYGMIIASLGGLLCIKIIQHKSYIQNLKIALFLHFVSYLLVYYFSLFHLPKWFFYVCVTSEEFSRGMTMIIFWSYQTYICKRQHVLIQLASLTAIDSLSYSLFSSVSGFTIDSLGYSNFILIVMLSFAPAFVILSLLKPSASPKV